MLGKIINAYAFMDIEEKRAGFRFRPSAVNTFFYLSFLHHIVFIALHLVDESMVLDLVVSQPLLASRYFISNSTCTVHSLQQYNVEH